MPNTDLDLGMSLAQLEPILEREAAQEREKRHRRRVRFDPARRVIDVAGYALDLDRAPNAVALLDWLIQIGQRCKPRRLRDVIDELEEACQAVFGMGIQGVYCPFEEPRVVDWRQGTTRAARLEDGTTTEPQPREAQ